VGHLVDGDQRQWCHYQNLFEMSECLKRLKEEFEKFQKTKEAYSFGEKILNMEVYMKEVSKLDLDDLLLSNSDLLIDDELAVMLGHYYSCIEKLKKLNPAEQKDKGLIKECEGLLWSGMPITKIYRHFDVMTKQLNKIGEPFLTQKQLHYFIEHVFINNSIVPEKIDINYVSGEKGFVAKRFHQFYTKACRYTKDVSTHRYIKMLCDNFQGMADDKYSVKHLFKPNISKRDWI